jgi:hypothetical protein
MGVIDERLAERGGRSDDIKDDCNGGSDIPVASIPCTIFWLTALSADLMVSLAASTALFCTRTEVLNRRVWRRRVWRNIFAGSGGMEALYLCVGKCSDVVVCE